MPEPPFPRSRASRIRSWLVLAALVVAFDQLTKSWITALLATHRRITVTDFFDLVLVHNPGAAFSFLADESGWQRWFFVVLALGVSVWLVRLLAQHAMERWMPLALALILGGAIGNVIDRIRVGAVIDFLHFHIDQYAWPAFNVADSAISVGVALLVWDQLRGHRSPAGETR